MITLNLISPRHRQELKLRQTFLVVKTLIILLLLTANVVAMVLLAGRIILQNSFNRIVADTSLTTQYGNIFSKDLKVFKTQLGYVQTVQEQYVPWTSFVAVLSELTPAEVGVTNLAIDRAAGTVVLSGVASTRDHLLELRDQLENSALFSDVIVPIDSLLKREQVDFEIRATVDLSALSQ